MASEPMQLKMNFAPRDGTLRKALECGRFSVLIELPRPNADTDINIVTDNTRALAEAARKSGFPSLGLAITEPIIPNPGGDIQDFAERIVENDRGNHLLYLGGYGLTAGEQEQRVRRAINAGFINLVPVSGEAPPGVIGEPHAESVHAIKAAAAMPDAHVGCVVNPFKYGTESLMSQYLKMLKKIGLGAGFAVTQLGWDMLKLRETRCYLNSRGAHIPTIARGAVLTPELYTSIINGAAPGIRIPPYLDAALKKEIQYSRWQFEAAQWRRLQLFAAGCRLLGYSGVQVAGIETPERLKIAAARINEALQEFNSFDEWRKAYQEYSGSPDTMASRHRFYLYDSPLAPINDTPPPPRKQNKIPPPGVWDKARALMLSVGGRKSPIKFIKKTLASCVDCGGVECALNENKAICPWNCPKGFANGPCGAVGDQGECPEGLKECVHTRRLRQANADKKLDIVETGYIPPRRK